MLMHRVLNQNYSAIKHVKFKSMSNEDNPHDAGDDNVIAKQC